ncbi:MAG: Coenzyme F420 hydrogenase/dehydrogenase, beta subunit C-terminal domain [Sphaerochaeta sp.]|nr:Coenzyme F420 hydrogenase/dehydrogenase, beta subunit C-terminal domain [Sphaerochaeta sp.]
MNNITIVGEHCFGCTACEHICPVGCITLSPDDKGFLLPVVDESACIECGLCLGACPYLGDGYPRSSEETLALAAKHRDSSTRMHSSSGGAFTAISDSLLEQGGVLYGAAYDEAMKVRHMRCISKAQRDALRGSKYVQSDLGQCYKEVEQDLKAGRRVLFTGTPCQVAGLRGYLGREYEQLLLVDLLCYGVPSPKVFADYVADIEGQEGKRLLGCSFRNKSKGWRAMLMHLDFGSKSIFLDASLSSYYALFLKGTILRPCCYECPFCSFDRPGDMTIGDFWGIEDTMPEFEDEKGVSLILVNSPKGKVAFQAMANKLDHRQSSRKAALQPALSAPTPADKHSDAFWKEYTCFGYGYVVHKYGGAE